MKKHLLKYFIPVAAICLMYACSKTDGVTNQPYASYGVSSTQGQLKINLAFAYTVDYVTILIKLNGKHVRHFRAAVLIPGVRILPCISLFR